LASGRFVHEYQKNAVNGASPLQLVIMLYDGALKAMEAAKRAMSSKDLTKQHDNLIKAQKIVCELTACLDMQQGGEIATNLFALYTYVTNELVQANIDDNPDPIDRSIRVMSELRESWTTIERSLRNEPQDLAA
jgi:flagellar protein FliS